jgi:biopolymer transport protein ExbB
LDADLPITRILKAGYEWRKGSTAEIQAAVEEAVDEVLWQLKRSVRPLGIIANTAPLLGLLGTVTGIIAAFDVVARQGSLGDPGALAGGISEALLTTGFGLIVAIPTLLAYHYFIGRAETLLRKCEIMAKENLILPPE